MEFGFGCPTCTVKSTTLTCCVTELCSGPLFALAAPETAMVSGGGTTVADGVTSTSTVAIPPTAKLGTKQGTTDPCTGAQFPVPLVSLAVGEPVSWGVGTVP